MTYFYLFETKDYVYCGQHRCANDKDPMKDCYKGSGSKWITYLKENNFWYINDFRTNVKKTILEIVMDDENRTCIGNVEKYWIENIRRTYGNKCLNISKGSGPSTRYDTYKEAKDAKNECDRKYREEHKKELKYYEQNRRSTLERKISYKKYNETPKRKISNKVHAWGYKYNYPEPLEKNLPKSWNDEDKQEYIRQYNNHYNK